jgi:23S rRNA (cytidine1920-2'-O)/16S rRNA (cytidine1409-2'-O)-methyltransferase
MSLRLDAYLVVSGMVGSREKARLAIAKGLVAVNGKPAGKASQQVTPADDVTMVAPPLRYVGRGGLKLEKAIQIFQVDFAGKTVLDIGASTGGFTDCALQFGAKHVTAVDVGAGQLDPSLSKHPQVLSLEKTDIREMPPSTLPYGPVDWVVIDVSFISLCHIIPCLPALMAPGAQLIALVKPQFELDERVRLKKGIVKDEMLRLQALEKVRDCAQKYGLTLQAHIPTDADGQQKNVEYLAWFA